MSTISSLLFFFVVLPIIYTILLTWLVSVVCNSVKQIKQTEYAEKLKYDQAKARIGQETVEQIKRGAVAR